MGKKSHKCLQGPVFDLFKKQILAKAISYQEYHEI